MKITTEFDDTLLQNEDKFANEFFKQFPLTKRRVQLGDVMEKEYNFPTLYGDVTCAQAIFLCSYEAALKIMPHEKIKPIRARKDYGVVGIACYEYKNVLGIPAYNEIALTIAVDVDNPKSKVLLPLITNKYSGYYVFSMPVTSRENCLRGNHIWGLPKVTQEIDIDTSGPEAIIHAFDDAGNEYFKLRVPKEGKATPMDESTYLYSQLNGEINKAQTAFRATFAISKNMGVLLNPQKQPDKPYLELDDSPYGKAIAALDLQPMPLQLRYAEHMNACFDYYDESFKLR